MMKQFLQLCLALSLASCQGTRAPEPVNSSLASVESGDALDASPSNESASMDTIFYWERKHVYPPIGFSQIKRDTSLFEEISAEEYSRFKRLYQEQQLFVKAKQNSGNEVFYVPTEQAVLAFDDRQKNPNYRREVSNFYFGFAPDLGLHFGGISSIIGQAWLIPKEGTKTYVLNANYDSSYELLAPSFEPGVFALIANDYYSQNTFELLILKLNRPDKDSLSFIPLKHLENPNYLVEDIIWVNRNKIALACYRQALDGTTQSSHYFRLSL